MSTLSELLDLPPAPGEPAPGDPAPTGAAPADAAATDAEPGGFLDCRGVLHTWDEEDD